MKRVFIVHGWDGHPEEGWFPWLKGELEAKGFTVEIPTMPDPAEPKIEKWVPHLVGVVDEADSQTYFVGHSIGCQTILRYLATLTDSNVGGVVFVAPWFVLTNAETEEEKRIGKPWLETPVDFKKVNATTNKFVTIFSTDDPVVPLEENRKLFEERFPVRVLVEEGKGHFSGSDGITELPSALDAILTIAQN